MKAGEIDRSCAGITGRRLIGTATQQDETWHEILMRARRENLRGEKEFPRRYGTQAIGRRRGFI